MNDQAITQRPLWHGGELRCIEKKTETHDSASFTLASDTPTRFEFKPGQFATIGLTIDGVQHYRAYSMSSSPDNDSSVTVTIRRVPGGQVSNYMLDHFRVGDCLDALALAGEFYLEAAHVEDRLVMLAAGSGVTPHMSMARWVLARKVDADIDFIYSARSERDIIFRDALLEMADMHPNFRLTIFLEDAGGRADRREGYLTPDRLDALIPEPTAARYYLCGNPAYMEMVEGWCRARGLPDDRLNKESFNPEQLTATRVADVKFQLAVPAFGKVASIGSNQTLLEIMEQNAIPIIGACRSGVCGSCKCKVNAGEVERISTATLTAEEVDAGFVLACSTHPRSDLEVELVL